MSERERARLAVIPTLHQLYCAGHPPLISESVVDMVAKQCGYDLDACVAMLGEMVPQEHYQQHQQPQSQPQRQHQPQPHAPPQPAIDGDGWEQLPPELMRPAEEPEEEERKQGPPPPQAARSAHPPGFKHTAAASASGNGAQLSIPAFKATAVPAQSNTPYVLTTPGAPPSLKSAIAAAAAEAAASVAASVASKPNGPSQRGIKTFLAPQVKPHQQAKQQQQQQQQQQQVWQQHKQPQPAQQPQSQPQQPASVWQKHAPAPRPAPRAPWSKVAGAGSSATQQTPPTAQQEDVDDEAANYRYTGPTLSRTVSARSAVSSSSVAEHAVEDAEALYDSDANDEEATELLKRARPSTRGAAANSSATYTGFESQPYFEMNPHLVESLPPLLPVPSIPAHTVLDPEAPSAALIDEDEEQGEDGAGSGVVRSSPAHPAHPLHALYLQLNEDAPPEMPDQGLSWRQFAGDSAAASVPSSLLAASSDAIAEHSLPDEAVPLEEMTPAQALAWQQQQEASSRQSKKQAAAWLRQHEADKRAIRVAGALVPPTEAERIAQEREEAELAEALRRVAESEAAAAELERLNLTAAPSDIPHMPRLSRADQRHSQERLQADPSRLVSFLTQLFAADVEPAVIRAVVESVLASAPPLPDERGVAQRERGREEEHDYRDLAAECCDTLLAIIDEEAEEEHAAVAEAEAEERAFAESAAAQQQSQPQPRGGKAWRKQRAAEQASAAAASSVPFVAAAVQMTDAEIAARMAEDPTFDPNELANADASADALAAATRASLPPEPVQRNKRGHVVVNRAATPNFWANYGSNNNNVRAGGRAQAAQAAAASSASLASVAPDLGAQWRLQALRHAFPLVDSDLLEQTFVANQFSFERAKAHLCELFPGSLVDNTPLARPQPVHTPWAAQSQHHSKIISTSATDAARGVVTEERLAAEARAKQAHYDLPDGVYEASGHLSDEALEAALGPLLDGRGASAVSVDASSSEESLRALADVHAARRRAYFGAAASAFSRGQGAVASQLASRGRAERSELQRAQSAAVLATIVAHNAFGAGPASSPSSAGVRRSDATATLDFHGLRVAEALRVLAFVLARQRRRMLAGGMGSASATLQLITGVGNHSERGRARLQPALLDFLRRQPHAQCSTSTPGVIQVHLTR